jgi:Holliday junction DNA helicase RuvA
MFYDLNGKLAYKDLSFCVIDCGGVGYKLTISQITSESLTSKLDKEVRLFTHLAVREDGVELFGFGSDEERECFNRLTSVSGVGPKGALAILSEMLPETFAAAVMAEDARQISKANGVGPKLAQRICLELKDKVSKTNVKITEAQAQAVAAGKEAVEEATGVLVALGYSKHDAAKALEKCTADNVNDLVRQALRMLSTI